MLFQAPVDPIGAFYIFFFDVSEKKCIFAR